LKQVDEKGPTKMADVARSDDNGALDRTQSAGVAALATFSRYYLSSDLSDCRFEIDQEIFPAHKFVLASRSAYWKTMLFGSDASQAAGIGGFSSEGSSGTIRPGCTPEALKVLLRHVYTFETDTALTGDGVSVRGILEVAQLAQLYELPDLAQACVAYKSNRLGAENASSMLEAGVEFGIKKLVQRAEEFILENAEEIIEQDDFLNLRPSSLAQIVANNEFGVSSEVKLFRALVKYADRHADAETPEARRSVLAEVLPHVRYTLMSIEDLSTAVAPTNFLTETQMLPLFMYVGSGGKTGTPLGPVNPREFVGGGAVLVQFGTSDQVIQSPTELDPSIPHRYRNLTIESGGCLLTTGSAVATNGGVLVVFARRIEIKQGGSIDVSGNGFAGGGSNTVDCSKSSDGQGAPGCGSGGGGGILSGSLDSSYFSAGGGGGGLGTNGEDGQPTMRKGGNIPGGAGGKAVGSAAFTAPLLGNGGGGSTSDYNVTGGAGGGAVVLVCQLLILGGKILADGSNGNKTSETARSPSSGAGGGSGGSIFISCQSIDVSGHGAVSAAGGAGGRAVGPMGAVRRQDAAGYSSNGGNGGVGRIRICNLLKSSASDVAKVCVPPPNTDAEPEFDFKPYQA
jgi:BTB And C-terminal Kelch/BTB/POZ domain